MFRIVVEAGYGDYLEENYANGSARLEDIEQIAAFARQFDSLEDFLTQLALLNNVEAEQGRAPRSDEERIRLSTIHQAKGLEFDVVFIIMLCDGLFPSSRSLESKEGLEEERRLFYVALTRARDDLYLCYPLMRGLAGRGGESTQRPSRFLAEIPRDSIEEVDLTSAGPARRYGSNS